MLACSRLCVTSQLSRATLKQFQQKYWHVYVQKPKWRSHLKERSEGEAARKELFEKARKERSQMLMLPFVGVGASARKEQPRLSTSAAVDSIAPGIAALEPSISAPLEAFFAGIGVDGQQFLSPDVNGQKRS